MISKEEVKKLSQLARLEVTDQELEKLQGELGAILDYIGQINGALTDENMPVSYASKNIMREDIQTNSCGQYTNDLLTNAPETESGFVKVKKII